ncbi:MAG TPA: hypothetical protein VE999_07965 [Gemmataceae bacterium]|jgi:hypothetical protein|nr:hypothetical protein [Gemmataceae bacterium]
MKAILIAAALAALPLGGCCLSVGGCEVPLATAATAPDWDGLGPAPASSAPTDITSDRTRSKGRQPKDAYTSTTTGNSWKDDDAQLQMDDARVKKKLIICDGCAVAHN